MSKHYDEIGGALFERLVVGATITDLIEQSYLVDCDIYAPSEPDLKGIRSRKGMDGVLDYNQNDLEEATDKPELIGDILTHWRKLANGKQTVVFATSIAHSKHICQAFNGADIGCRAHRLSR